MSKTQPSRKSRPYRGMDSELRRRMRRRALIEAGLDLFGTKGYRATSVKAVCDRAGLTERYFYESFSNREALLAGVYDTLAANLDARLRGAASEDHASREERLRRVPEIFFRFVRDDPRRARVMLFEVLGVSPEIDRRYQASVRAFGALLEQPAFGLFPPETVMPAAERRVAAIGLVGAISQIGVQWVLEEFRTSTEDVVQAALEILRAMSLQAEARARG